LVTAEFSRTSLGLPDHEPLVVVATVGVSHGPAYRLWPVVCDDERCELAIGVGDLLRLPDDPEIELAAVSDVPGAAGLLASPVVEHSPAWAAQHASLDVLIEANRGGSSWFGWEVKVVPLLLATAGRHEEARAALAGA
jgi:hypothetical protein